MAPPSTRDQLYEYLNNIKDAATGLPITKFTSLASLRKFALRQDDDRLLKNLTCIADPAATCYFHHDGHQWPHVGSEEGYRMQITFKNLLVAPVLRLTCDFYEGNVHIAEPYLTLALDFHWNACGEIAPGVVDFATGAVTPGTTGLFFSTNGATSSGFNKLTQFTDRLSDEAKHVVKILRTYLQPAAPLNVKLVLEDHTISSEVRVLRSYLPGGSRFELQSLHMPEWQMFRDRNDDPISLPRDHVPRPMKLIGSTVPHPMVELPCEDTFSSVDEAVVQLAHSVQVAYDEEAKSLELWSTPITKHMATLYHFKEVVVMAVKFSEYKKLEGVERYRLPSELATKIFFKNPSTEEQVEGCRGVLNEEILGLPHHHAFFTLKTHFAKDFGGFCADAADLTRRDYFQVSFEPKMGTSTRDLGLATVEELRKKDNGRWHGIILNQLHDGIPLVDLLNDPNMDPDVVMKEYTTLENWMQWNVEQLEVIKGIRRTRGRMIVVMGPAGTGKTLLQQALALFFYRIGYHVAALAPANSNANYTTNELAKRQLDDVDFVRAYPESYELPLSKIHKHFARSEDADRSIDGPVTVAEIQYTLLNSHLGTEENKHVDASSYDLQRKVIRAAKDGELVQFKRLREQEVKAKDPAPPEDVWQVFREALEIIETGAWHWLLVEQQARYLMSYKYCKRHILGLSRFLITTTGNIRSDDITTAWATGEYVPCKGVIVFVDEAAKDIEVNVWAGVVCESWADKVKGVVLFGDDKQLKPVNKSGQGRVVYSAFHTRMDIPLPCRLVNEGFPCVRLKEQRRMNRCISAFPNRHFYEGTLRDGPGTDSDLEPNLKKLLVDTIATGIMDQNARAWFLESATDEHARLHYIEVLGQKEKDEQTSSSVVREHIKVFFEKIFFGLHEHFGSALVSNVMVICAYSHAKRLWRRSITTYQEKFNLSASHMPNLVMLDSSQGCEAPIVVFDGSFQHRDRLGFLTERERSNVAMTRARDVFWMLGGALGPKDNRNTEERPYWYLYKQELEAMGRCHRFT